MVSVRRRILESASADLGNYVTDDMVFWLDGINNTFRGHDSASEYWYDLSGNGHDFAIGSYNTWSDDHLTMYRGIATENALPSDFKHTEIVFKNAGNETTTMMIFPHGNKYVCFFAHSTQALAPNGSAGSYPRLSLADSWTDLHAVSFPRDYNAGTDLNKIYLDGQLATTTTASSGTWNNVQYKRIGGYSSLTDDPYKGNIYAIRLYNRVLTDAEILQNWYEDQRRFFGGN